MGETPWLSGRRELYKATVFVDTLAQ